MVRWQAAILIFYSFMHFQSTAKHYRHVSKNGNFPHPTCVQCPLCRNFARQFDVRKSLNLHIDVYWKKRLNALVSSQMSADSKHRFNAVARVDSLSISPWIIYRQKTILRPTVLLQKVSVYLQPLLRNIGP